tara:strand:- start:151 stop:480 length:330 start_codon:yes stop_codon:yes gene_type:complete
VELDTRLLLTVGGMLVSIVSAFVIVKTKLQTTIDQLLDIESRLRSLDRDTDAQQVSIENLKQRADVTSEMLAPKERETRAREMATVRSELATCQRDLEVLKKMHNGEHK